jgi:N-acetyl-anhydromuramyl-L-alanine amidase AmpD
MIRRLLGLVLLLPLGALASTTEAAAGTPVLTSSDYPIASSRAAAASNYTVANRPRDYSVDFIVIHDTEGSYGSAIRAFQNPSRHASAHYVISYRGQITQMVAEKDIAWHAGNWDYNTRSIGIEHEGFAYTPGLYTSAEYHASAHLVASICSRWGVPLNRRHVIGHYQVPDPSNPLLFGGSEHHTDPGPYWNWSYYIALAKAYSLTLPSPPHFMLNASAFSGDTTATVTWRPARTCFSPIASYTVVAQPGNIQMTLPGTTTTATFTGLANGVDYTFTVTAHNAYGIDAVVSNVVTPGTSCATAAVTATPALSSSVGGAIHFTATSTGCTNPTYEFWIQASSGSPVLKQAFGGAVWSWNTYGYAAGNYTVSVWANHATSDASKPEALTSLNYVLNPFAASHWSAGYDMSGAPTNWVAGQSQTFRVTVTNTGDVIWPSTGYTKVDLELHFTTQTGGSAKVTYWLTNNTWGLGQDLAPGNSVTYNVTLVGPSTSGSMYLEAEMIKEHQFWFAQSASIPVTVS